MSSDSCRDSWPNGSCAAASFEYGARVASTYCNANWETSSQARWGETFTLGQCKSLCTSSSTCKAIAYGSAEGQWTGYCVLCDNSDARKNHVDWDLYVKGNRLSFAAGDRSDNDDELVIEDPETTFDCNNPGYIVNDKSAAFKKVRKSDKKKVATEKKKLLVGWPEMSEAICDCTTFCYNGGYGFWSIAAKKTKSDCVCTGEEATLKKVKNRSFTGKKRYALGSLSETAEAKLEAKVPRKIED